MELTILLDDPNMRAQQTQTPFADALARLDTLTRSRLDGTQHAGTFPAALADFTGEHFARFDVPVESNTALMRALRELENLYGTFALTAQLTETEDSDRGCWIFTNGTEDVQRAFVDAMFEQASPGACVIVDEGAATPALLDAIARRGGLVRRVAVQHRHGIPTVVSPEDIASAIAEVRREDTPVAGVFVKVPGVAGVREKNEGDTKRLVQAAKAAGVPIVFDGDAEPDHPCSLAKGFCPVGYEADGWFGSMAGQGGPTGLAAAMLGPKTKFRSDVIRAAMNRNRSRLSSNALAVADRLRSLVAHYTDADTVGLDRARAEVLPLLRDGFVVDWPAAGYATAASHWLVLDPTAYQVDGFTLADRLERLGVRVAAVHPSFVTLSAGLNALAFAKGVRHIADAAPTLFNDRSVTPCAPESIPSWTVTQEIHSFTGLTGKVTEYVDIASATGRMLADHVAISPQGVDVMAGEYLQVDYLTYVQWVLGHGGTFYGAGVLQENDVLKVRVVVE